MRGIEKNFKTLSDAGIRTVAISVDTPEKTRVKMVQEAGYTFTFLSDPKLEAIRRYDLVHASDDPTLPPIAGKKGADVARPAEFLMMTASNSSLHYRNCNLCEAICGVESTIQGDQRLDVRGDQDDHFSQGYICPKAAALRDLHYG